MVKAKKSTNKRKAAQAAKGPSKTSRNMLRVAFMAHIAAEN